MKVQQTKHKTGRQRFELQKNINRDQIICCLNNNVEQFKHEHTLLVGSKIGTHRINFNKELDWQAFLKEQDRRFCTSMAKQSGRWRDGRKKEVTQWRHMMNTFTAATKISNPIGADRRYQAALAALGNIR
jgi:hypothetical protein